MTTGFFQFFNSKAQRAQGRANGSQNARSGRDRSPLKPRRLMTEALEERQLLAVDVLSMGAAIQQTEAAPNVINITSSDYSIEAIKEAIRAAAATPEDDIIRISSGTLKFASASDEIEINIDSEAFGSLTIQGLGSGVTIDADNSARVFSIKSGTVELQSITLTNGSAEFGGAIANAGDLTLDKVTLNKNAATGDGGAIANKGSLAIQDSVITNNFAAGDGASVYNGDFAWPQIVTPEWTGKIEDVSGVAGSTVVINLPDYCSAGDWTYAFSCSNPSAAIFSAEPTIENGKLTLKFLEKDAYEYYTAEVDLSSVDFTVTASDGTTTVAQSFKVAHELQTTVVVSAILSNMTMDDVADEYYAEEKSGRKVVKWGYVADEIPASEVVSTSTDDLYLQLWVQDKDYDNDECWNCGKYKITGFVFTVRLTNATLVGSLADEFPIDAGGVDDLGGGLYRVAIGYTSGAPYGYAADGPAMMATMLQIKALDPSQPVVAEIAQASADFTDPSMTRSYTSAVTPDGRSYTKIDPSQMLFVSSVSNSTTPYSSKPGVPFGADFALATLDSAAFANESEYAGSIFKISNSLIANNSASGSGVISFDQTDATIVSTTIAGNSAQNAALYADASSNVVMNNTIVVNDGVAPVVSGVIGSNNLVNAPSTSWTEYDSSKPLFVNGGYSLATGSQALNIGDNANAVSVSGEALTTDLAGAARISAIVDLGAYEYQGSKPGAPVNVTVSDYVASAKNPTLSWTAPSAIDGVDGYYVYFGSSTTPIATVTDTQLAKLGDIVTLQDGTTYKFSVVAFNIYGQSSKATVTLDTTVPPTAPSDVVVGDYADNTAAVTWAPVSNATSYRVTLENVDAGTFADYTTTATAYVLTGLADFTNYSVTVTAINARGEASSDAVAFNTTVAPSVPTGLVATKYNGDGTSTVSWNAVDHASGYKLAMKVDGAWKVVASSDATSYKFTGLANNSSYVFGVASYATKDGVDLTSEFAEITVVTTVAPNAPTNLKWVGEYASNAATLQWTPSAGAAGYTVAIYQDGAWNVLGSTTGRQYKLTNLADNQEYVVGVAAYSVLDGERLYSDYSSVSLNTVVAPAAATNAHFLEYVGGSSASLTWNASAGGATGYVVEQQIDGVWTKVGDVSSVGYTATVEENSYYTFRVVAYNTVGSETRYADPSSVAGIDTLVPPQGEISVVVGDYDYSTGSAKLTWTNLAHAGYYSVAQKLSGETEFSIIATSVSAGEGSTVSYDLSGLAQHSSYEFRVVAYNAKGEGSVGYSDAFYTAAPPAAPVASYRYDSASASATISYSAAYATSYIVKDSEGNVLYSGTDTSYVATGLAENQTYNYAVIAVNAEGESVATPVSVYTAAVPQAPSNVAIGAYVGHSATLTWDDVEAETGYNVYSMQNGEWVKIDTLAAGTVEYTFVGLEDFSVYTYCVAAYNEIGESAKSASVLLDTTVAPNAPTDLTFTFGDAASYQGDGKATFNWSLVEHAVGYAVQQKIDGVWTTIATTTSNSYDLSGLANYSVYEFGVAAYSVNGTDKLFSEYATAELSTAWIPTAEMTLTVGAYDAVAKTAQLSWNAIEAADQYKVEQYVDGAWQFVGTTTATEYSPALADNMNYTFRVVAVNEIGSGSNASVSFFTAAAPAAPSVRADYDSQSMTITLSYSSDFATSYVVTDENGVVLYEGSDKTYVATGLAENVTYTFNVVAVNAEGSSAAKTVSVYTAAVPAAPTNLVVGEYAKHAVTLYWDVVANCDGYRVYLQTESGWAKVGGDLDANSNLIRLTDLADYSKYVLCVSAFNSEGESAKSEPVTIDTTIAPAAVDNLHYTFGESATYQGDGKATLVWNTVANADGYDIKQKIDGEWTTVATTTDSSYDLTDLENFNVYEYGVVAFANRGTEKLSAKLVSAELNTQWIPTGDLALSVTDYDYVAKSSTLYWNAVEHADGYRVERLVDDAWTVVATVTETEYVLALADNTEYTYRVVAENAVGDGSSASVTFFTAAPPAAPIDAKFVEYVPETGKATMTWSAVAYAEWYEVRYQVEGEWVTVQRDVNNFTAEGLVEDREYVYEVRACNHVGSEAAEGYSDWITVVLDTHPQTAPKAPSDLAVVGYDEATTSATLVWKDNSANEERFVVQRSFDGETWVDVAYVGENVTSCKLTSLQRGSVYKYRVCAENQYGASEWVEIEYVVPSGAPAAPSDVVFSDYDQETKTFEMSWVDNSVNELYFKVEYTLDGETWNGSYTVAANTTSLNLVNMVEGQVYTFRVSAWNSYGVSEYAYGTYEVPLDGKTRPAAPSDFIFGEFNYANNTLPMYWTDNAGNEDGFVVEFSFDGETWRKGGSTAADVTTRTATGMIVGRTYYFRVAAFNVAGQSAWTYSGAFRADSTIVAPENVVVDAATYRDGNVEMSWTYAGDLSVENGGFIIQYSDDLKQTWKRAGETKGNQTSRTATKLVEGRTYYFRVAAYDGSVYSDWTESTVAFVAPKYGPTAPTDLNVSIENGVATLNWSDTSSVELGFNVQYSIDGGETWVSGGNTAANVTTKTISSLRWTGEYQFRVRAYNHNGASDWVVVSSEIAPSENVPNAPSDIVFGKYDASAKTLQMSWTDNSNNEQGFTVQYTYDGGKTWYFAGGYGENVTSRLATGLVAGRVYQFRVCAYNADGASDWAYSEEFNAVAPENVPAAPTDLIATLDADAKSATLNWTDHSFIETGFKVESSVNGGAWTVCGTVSTNVTTFVASNLASNSTYAFRVAAVNGSAVSELSNEASVVVPVAPETAVPTIEGFTYSARKREIVMTWAALENAISYQAQYKVEGADWIGMKSNGTSATLSGAISGKVYSFQVRAVYEDGTYSDWSEGWYDTTTGEHGVSNALLDVLAEDESIDLIANGLLATAAVDEYFQGIFEEEL